MFIRNQMGTPCFYCNIYVNSVSTLDMFFFTAEEKIKRWINTFFEDHGPHGIPENTRLTGESTRLRGESTTLRGSFTSLKMSNIKHINWKFMFLFKMVPFQGKKHVSFQGGYYPQGISHCPHRLMSSCRELVVLVRLGSKTRGSLGKKWRWIPKVKEVDIYHQTWRVLPRNIPEFGSTWNIPLYFRTYFFIYFYFEIWWNS